MAAHFRAVILAAALFLGLSTGAVTSSHHLAFAFVGRDRFDIDLDCRCAWLSVFTGSNLSELAALRCLEFAAVSLFGTRTQSISFTCCCQWRPGTMKPGPCNSGCDCQSTHLVRPWQEPSIVPFIFIPKRLKGSDAVC